jgi:hypothetical protein
VAKGPEGVALAVVPEALISRAKAAACGQATAFISPKPVRAKARSLRRAGAPADDARPADRGEAPRAGATANASSRHTVTSLTVRWASGGVDSPRIPPDSLLGDRLKPPFTDSITTPVLVRGEPIVAPPGRADDFVWPRRESLPGPATRSSILRFESYHAALSSL